MPIYDYKIAKSVLNQADKDRILCLYLSSNSAEIDWERATAAFGGSCTVKSFKEMTCHMHKRIKKAGGEVAAFKTTTKRHTEGQAPPKKRPLRESGKAGNLAKSPHKKTETKHEDSSDGAELDDVL